MCCYVNPIASSTSFYTDRTGREVSKEEVESVAKVRLAVAEAWRDLSNAIDNSNYGRRSRNFASIHSDYWSRPTEMGARSFAVWVENQLTKKGNSNDYLANNPHLTANSSDNARFFPYPLEDDNERMDDTFGQVFNVIEERKNGDKFELYSNPNYHYLSSDKHDAIKEKLEEKFKKTGGISWLEYVYLDNFVYICNVKDDKSLDFEVTDIKIEYTHKKQINNHRNVYAGKYNIRRFDNLFVNIVKELKSTFRDGGASSVGNRIRQGRSDVLDLLAQRIQANGRRNSKGYKTLRRVSDVKQELNVETGKEYGVDKLMDCYFNYASDGLFYNVANKVFGVASKLGLKVRFEENVTDKYGNIVSGVYSPIDNAIVINIGRMITDNRDNAAVMLHEIIHSCVSYALDAYENGIDLPKPVKGACEDIKKIYDAIKDSPILRGEYGVESTHEMIAELANPDWRNKLQKINVLTKIIDLIKKFIGL